MEEQLRAGGLVPEYASDIAITHVNGVSLGEMPGPVEDLLHMAPALFRMPEPEPAGADAGEPRLPRTATATLACAGPSTGYNGGALPLTEGEWKTSPRRRKQTSIGKKLSAGAADMKKSVKMNMKHMKNLVINL